MDLSIVKIIAPIILAVMMFGMGLTLTVKDFTRVLFRPKAIILGSVLQILMLPVIGFMIAKLFMLPPILAVGVMLLVACPGGPGSNLLAFLCRGDTALSISLTAISSLLAVVSIPLVVSFAAETFLQENQIEVSVVKMSLVMFFITLIPVTLGMFVGKRYPKFASACEKPVKILSMAFLIFLVIMTFVKERDHLGDLLVDAGLAVVTLCIVSVMLGFVGARLLKLSGAVSKTIAIEVGIQNAALAIVVASSVFNSEQMAMPAAIYSPVMLTAAMLFLLHAYLTRGSAPGKSSQVEVGASSLKVSG